MISSSGFFYCKIFVCLVIVTRYFPSRVLMTFSLVVVACFAMSLALRSAAIARLVLDASLLHCTRERPTLLNCADQSLLLDETSVRCGDPSSLSLLLVAVHSLSAWRLEACLNLPFKKDREAVVGSVVAPGVRRGPRPKNVDRNLRHCFSRMSKHKRFIVDNPSSP